MVTSGVQLVREELRAFAEALAGLLQTRGLSQAELADVLDVSPSAVSNWTLGRQRPTPANVEAAEDALSVPRGHLARHLGYLPVTAGPRAETLEEFLDRDGQLLPEQRAVLIQVYAQFLRTRAQRRGKDRRNGEQ